ncbi:ThiF family adenylyltransferase [Guyparkeria sp. SB14A]|uniref:tRNA threonylcarbamoyladenosine dehydratase n=1 Tax=Guyparkeria sp. SB14A TaxID=2571147 RepID=UPI001FFC4C17|nr:ThiF family adenylyltransferase [Guyparkeria sp. SB14A]
MTAINPVDERTELLIGEEGIARLRAATVLVAGLGGVGGAAAESLARAGVGRLILLDHDTFAASNLNRQLFSTREVLGRGKAEVAVERLASIRDDIELVPSADFLDVSGVEAFLGEHQPDVVADCIDSIAVKARLLAVARAQGRGTFTALGAGNRIDPRQIQVGRLDRVHGCGLGAVLRRKLRKAGAPVDFPVVYSTETPRKPAPHQPTDDGSQPRAVNGTISYLPNLFGHVVAGEIIRRILQDKR